MDEEPGVHALHARLQHLPFGALDGLVHEGVFRDQEPGGFRQLGAELPELLDGQALVADGGDEVAVLELLLDFIDGLFLLRAADGGVNFGEIWGLGVEFGAAVGGGEEGVPEVGFEGEGGGRRRKAGGGEGEEGGGLHCWD